MKNRYNIVYMIATELVFIITNLLLKIQYYILTSNYYIIFLYHIWNSS